MNKRDDLYLREIESRIEKISAYLKKSTYAGFLKSDLHRSAVVRELEVIGEAASKVTLETRGSLKAIPWNQMIGMRNRLIHGYFDVDYSIVWEVAKKEIPKLLPDIHEAILLLSPPLHPWRVCPSGYYHVRRHSRAVNPPPKHTSVRQHCRRNPSGKDQLYPKEIEEIFSLASAESLGDIGSILPKRANIFDREILVWTRYWNDVLTPAQLLDANIVKALLGSESSFGSNSKDVRISKNNFARGPFQVTDETRKILADEKGELDDHYLTLTASDVKRPSIGAAAAVRWLFQKKKLASSFLKREATWEEAVADYKGYLRKKKPYREQRGMKSFFDFLAELRKEAKK